METIFNNPEINKLANMLLNNGFDIIKYKSENNWFSYHKGGKIAYFQYNTYEGYTISSVHKPNRNCGTGFRILESKDFESTNYEPTIKDFEKGFVFAPSWASNADASAVKKWGSLEEYTSNERILKYTIIKSI